MSIEWRQSTEKFDNGVHMFLGKYRVGSVQWDGINRTDENYAVFLNLPGIKSRLKKQYKTREEAIEMAEETVRYWIKNSGLIENSET